MEFRKLSECEVFERMKRRKMEIRHMEKLPPLDKLYLSFISKYESVEITPDIEIYGYEKVLYENRYLVTNYSDISQQVWMIGTSGQGDGWFINKESNLVLFYDHDQGEYSNITQFTSLNISFCCFLQMAFLYQDLEKMLRKQENVNKILLDAFVKEIDSIYPNLFKAYPYKYF